MCKYHLSREQPYVQGLSCGQPEQVSNMNNEFSRVTAVSVGTRGIWLCSVKQQGEGIRRDTFYVQDEVRESSKAWGTAGHQALSNRFSIALTIALSLCRRLHQIQLVAPLHPGLRAGAQCCWPWGPALPAFSCSVTDMFYEKSFC